MLELLKHGQARAEQEASFGPIWVYRGANFGRPMGEVDWTAEVDAPVEVASPGDVGTFDDTDLAMHAPVDAPLHDEMPVGETEKDHGESESR
jgi:hypothetical protein